MTLKRKLLILFTCVSVVILALVGGILYREFRQKRLEAIDQEVVDQLEYLDFAVTNFLAEVEHDVEALAQNDLVRSTDDAEFTSFLEADEETFQYEIGDLEQAIIDVLNTLQTTHPYVNSVYMGRENGSFVRSHPRARPTQYDPRERPWYSLAAENPGQVMRTAPYRSVTTPDVNLGVVTALVDEDGAVYGVVGADVTLVSLTDFISVFKMGHQGRMLLVDESGIILAGQDVEYLFSDIGVLLGNRRDEMINSAQGMIVFDSESGSQHLFFHRSPQLGWQIAAVIPATVINQEIQSAVAIPLLGLFLALCLLNVLALYGLNSYVVNPLQHLSNVASRITRTGDLDQVIELKTGDELESLAISLNQMMDFIRAKEQALKASELEVRQHRDHLEELVEERTAELVKTNVKLEEEIEERKLLENDLQSALNWTGALYRASRSLIAPDSLPQLLQSVVDGVVEALPAERVTLITLNQEAKQVTNFVKGGPGSALVAPVSYDELLGGLTGWVIRELQPALSPKGAPDPRESSQAQKRRVETNCGSILVVPMRYRDKTLGTMTAINRPDDRDFTERDLELMMALGNQVAVAIENRRLFEETAQQLDELNSLYQVSRELVATLDMEDLLPAITQQLADSLEVDRCAIFLFDDQTGVLRARSAHGYNAQNLESFSCRPGERIVGRVFATGEPWNVRDISHVQDLTPLDEMRSVLAVPLASPTGGPMGALSVASRRPSAFGQSHLRLLETVAGQIVGAVEAVRLYRRTEQHAGELAVLYEVGKDITATLDLEIILQTIVDSATALIECDKSLLLLVDRDKERLTQAVGHGYSQQELSQNSFAEFQKGISGWVLQHGTPTLSADIQIDERNQGRALEKALRSGDGPAAVAPLLLGEEVIGTLTVINGRQRGEFSFGDLNLVTMLAGQASIAIHNAQLYEAAQEADRIKSAFLASMSHELRTPLNSIIGFTGMILEGLVGPLNDEQAKQLNMVFDSANHLLDLINDVLDISKIEAGQLEVASELVDVRAVIEKVVRTLSPAAERKNLELIPQISPQLGEIISDGRRVEQILINLVNNAIKFTEQGTIHVQSRISDGWVETCVTDTGSGIKPEDMGQLFQAFKQIDTGVARRYEGTGLGLSICQKLVELLGGKIWVESEWGVGSTFAFRLPSEG